MAELGAVLAIGWLVPQIAAIVWFVRSDLIPAANVKSWFLTTQCLAATVVTLSLMRRSGDSWETFGLTRPGPGTLIGGLVMMAVDNVASIFGGVFAANFYSVETAAGIDAELPVEPLGNFEIVASNLCISLAGEVVFRAWLLVRLSTLLRSNTKAVLVSSLLYGMLFLDRGPFVISQFTFIAIAYCVAFLMFRRLWPLVIGSALTRISIEFEWFS